MHDKRARDQLVAEIAGRQHGAISTRQLREAGLSRDSILEARRAGRLHPLHRGVYAVGHVAPSNERRWMAAVLALGEGTVLSHRSAAALWRLLPPANGAVDVSLPSRSGRRRRSGIRVHRPESLPSNETTRRRGIPVTSPARTLVDMRPTVPEHELRRAIRQADYLGLDIGPDISSDRTRSELERRFLWLCRRHHLPEPRVNVRIGKFTVDFHWPETRLIVETDGYRAHSGRTAFEDDHARDLELRMFGYEVVHFSYRQVFDEPRRVVTLLRTRLTSHTRAH